MENIIYLDEDAVNEELITHHGGQLKETIERVGRDISIGGEAEGQAGDPTGLFARLKGAISANYERGKEHEFVYDLTDEVAKFALLLEVLDASGATTVDGQFTKDDRSDLAMDSPIMITAPLIRTPIGEIKNRFDLDDKLGLLSEGVEELAASGLLNDEKAEELRNMQDDVESASLATSGMKKMFSSLSDDDDIYRTKTSSDIDFVMGLSQNNFRNRPHDFPSISNEYVVLGKIITKINRGDRVPLINFSKLAEMKVDNPRERETAQLQIKSDVAEMADGLLQRDVSTSEFELSHPDVQIKPLAIY